MTKATLTHVAMLLDRSGSMESIAEATIETFNGFLSDQKKCPHEATLTLCQFDDKYEPVHTFTPIQEVPALTDKTYQPRNSTALYDSIVRLIRETGTTLEARPEQERPGLVIVAVITDGLENASQEWRGRYAEIATMIREQTDKYGWQFIFLGANQDAIAEAGKLGIDIANAVTYNATPAGVAAAGRRTSDNITRNRKMSATGQGVNMSYSAEDREKIASSK